MSSIAIVLFINSVLGCRNEILIVICIDYSKEKVIFFSAFWGPSAQLLLVSRAVPLYLKTPRWP